MRVWVPHLDSLQEAWVPKQECLVSQRIKGEVNRRWSLEQAGSLVSCQATPRKSLSYLPTSQPKSQDPAALGLQSLAGLYFYFSIFFETVSHGAWDGLEFSI